MDLGDTLVFLLLAIGDIVLMAWLRRRRRRREQSDRMMRSLRVAVERQNPVLRLPARRRWSFRGLTQYNPG